MTGGDYIQGREFSRTPVDQIKTGGGGKKRAAYSAQRTKKGDVSICGCREKSHPLFHAGQLLSGEGEEERVYRTPT